jgi:hypothetical protein
MTPTRPTANRTLLCAVILFLGGFALSCGDDKPSRGDACLASNIVQLSFPTGAMSVSYTGTTTGKPTSLDPMTEGCGMTPSGPEVVHHLVVPGTGTFALTASTDDPATTAGDTVVYITTACRGGNELTCNDDGNGGNHNSTTDQITVTGGQELFIVVDTYDTDPMNAGAYKLTVTLTTPTCQDPSKIVTLTIPAGSTSTSYTGDTSQGVSTLDPMTPDCVPTTPTGPEIAHKLVIPGTGAKTLTASTVDPATTADTVVYVQTQCGGGTELACNDDNAALADPTAASEVTANVNGGDTVYIIVDTYATPGPYKLTVTVP